MVVTNISNIETLPPQIDDEQLKNYTSIYSKILKLGNQDEADSAKKQLTSIIKNTPNNTDTTNFAHIEDRYNFTLNAVLGAITEDQIDESPESSPSLRRQNAVEILNTSYTSLLKNNPQGAARAAYALTKKLDNPNKGTMKMYDVNSKEEQDLNNETSAVFSFLRNIACNVKKQPQEVSVNVFDAVIRNFRSIKDSNVFSEERRILETFFYQAIEAKDHKLYKNFIDIFFNRIEELDINNPEDYSVLDNISIAYIFNQLYERNEGISSEDRLEVNKLIFEKSISLINSCKDDGIRYNLIFTLSTAVFKNKEKWEHEPNLFAQQVDFHIKTLKTLIAITNEQRVLIGNSQEDATMILHEVTYDLLASMLEEYVDKVSNQNENWVTFYREYHSLYQQALRAYLSGINKGNKEIVERIIDQLIDFLSPSLLENPKHPFIKEGAEFYAKYYSQKLEELQKKEEKN